MKSFLATTGITVALIGAAMYAPYWIHKQGAAKTASYTSTELVEMRSSGGDMCIGTSWDHDSYWIDKRLMDQVDEGERITTSNFVYEDCVQQVTEHYEERGFVVEVDEWKSPSGEQEVTVTAAADYKRDTE